MSIVPRQLLRPDFHLPRLIKGGWQLSEGHGSLGRATALEDMAAFFDRGVDAFDCGDVYVGVEALIGQFVEANRRRSRAGAAGVSRDPIVLTKYIPDSAALGSIRKADVTAAVDRSLRRLKVEQLGVLQLHWWDLSIPGYLEVFHWLNDLRAEGKIRWLGAVNFDTKTLAEICADGIGVITTQVQYSLLDRRVEKSLASLCAHNDVHMLCYGTVAGGFLSDVWLGRPEPGTPLENRSLVKYKAIIDEFGGWGVFQQLLRTLKAIAERHGVDIATVAMRYVLEKPQVGALIIGARNTGHLEQNVRAFSFSLDSNDHAAIDAALALGRPLPGDFYELERDVTGPHGSLMKRNLNAASNAHPTVPKGSA